MILKTLTHDHGSSDVWNYYDNITAASVYYHEDISEVVISTCHDDMEGCIDIMVTEVAYLMSDKGDVIEKIVSAHKTDK